MPLERVSKGFKDISMTFQVNPLNYDTIALKNETAIARSIKNLVLTTRNERFFNPNLGCEISRSLFENISDLTVDVVGQQIRDTINRYEPRVQLDSVRVSPDYGNNELNVTVIYNIVGIDVPQQQLTFALTQTR
jgi:phage baseplate assembly protein W